MGESERYGGKENPVEGHELDAEKLEAVKVSDGPKEVFAGEQRLKATFKLKLGRGKECRTRSNTAVKEGGRQLVTGYFWDTYTTTPSMSTYLLA